MSFTLANATLVTPYPPHVDVGSISVSEGVLASVGEAISGEPGQVINCAGKIIVPGNVCAHTHLYSTLARGMPGPPHEPSNFPEILNNVWWRLDRALDDRHIYYSGLIGAIDAARSGTTTLIDHHASPNSIDGSLDTLARAIDAVGLRAVLCYEVTDRDGPEKSRAGLRENERFVRKNEYKHIAGMVGAHASFTLDDGTLAQLSELAADLETGVHIHVAEDVCDEEDALRRCGRRVGVRLADAGLLGHRSIAAHGVHLDDGELALLQANKSWLVHNCRSNMNNAVGRAQVSKFGNRAALGTDGIDGDMFAESRTAFFRAREHSLRTAAETFTRLLCAGSQLAGQYFSEPLGSLETGAAADLLILDYDPPTDLTVENVAWHWMFGLSAAAVEGVIVGGSWVVRNGEVLGVDEEKARAESRIEARRLWKRMEGL